MKEGSHSIKYTGNQRTVLPHFQRVARKGNPKRETKITRSSLVDARLQEVRGDDVNEGKIASLNGSPRNNVFSANRQASRQGEEDDDEKKPDSFAHVWIVAVECKHVLK